MNDRLQQVRALVTSGCSVLGTGRHTKRPSAPMPSWKHLQERVPNAEEIAEIANQPGIAVIGGKVSGNVELIDIECDAPIPEIEAALEAREPGLLKRLYRAETPTGGQHWGYRCPVIAGNQKLAGNSSGKTWIETRGEGGYFLTSLSSADAHPSGKIYRRIAGSLTDLPKLTPEERETLFEVLRSFNQYIQPQKARGYREALHGEGLKPGADYNTRPGAADRVREVLMEHGFTVFGAGGRGQLISRPGIKDHSSATLFDDGSLFVFSSNALPFASNEVYSAFAVYTLLKYNGDFSAAAKALGQLGFGSSNGHKPKTATPDQTQNTKAEPRFAVRTLRDLQNEPEEKVSYVMDETLVRGGTSLLVAKPKTGKTCLACNIAARGSQGQPYLGREMPKAKWCYLALEEKPSQMILRFRNLEADLDNIRIHVGPAPGSSPSESFLALKMLIQDDKPDAVIVDPMARLIRVADYNDYGQMNRALEPIVDLARQYDVHIMLVHHGRKGEGSSEDSALGSIASFANVDTMLSLSKQRDSARRIITSSQRYGTNIEETVLTFDDGRIEAGGDLKTALLNERKIAVAEAIGTEPITESAIKELVSGTNSGLTSKAIRALFDEGKLDRTGGGKRNDPFLYSKRLARALPDEIFIPADATETEIEEMFA